MRGSSTGTVGWQDRVVRRSLRDAAAQAIARAEELMAATVELMESSGEDVTVQEIADRAGVSLRVLYRQFPSKDALLIAVLEDMLAKAAEQGRRDLAEIDDPVERLAAFVLWMIDAPATPLHTALAKNALLLTVTSPDEVRRAQAPMAALAEDLVLDAGEAGQIDRELAPHGAYVLLELRRAYNHSALFGCEFGMSLPPVPDHVKFCLRALGIDEPSIERALAAASARPR